MTIRLFNEYKDAIWQPVIWWWLAPQYLSHKRATSCLKWNVLTSLFVIDADRAQRHTCRHHKNIFCRVWIYTGIQAEPLFSYISF
jgi:hypothetical protein